MRIAEALQVTRVTRLPRARVREGVGVRVVADGVTAQRQSYRARGRLRIAGLTRSKRICGKNRPSVVTRRTG